MNSYIIGTSLICNMGDNFKEISTNLKNLTQESYIKNLENIFKDNLFYAISNFDFISAEEKYKTILKKVIFDAIKDAKLSKEEQKELHIFIGSTSMEMSSNEEYRNSFLNNKSSLAFKDIGNGSIGEYIEELIDSKYKSILFTTACTSSANALCYASKLIQTKKIKRAIVIGIELYNSSTYGGFSSLMLLSKNKVYRPFDKNSDGIILGEACSAVILDSKKKTDFDFKYLSSSNICDNYSETTSNPSGIPIFNTMNQALKASNLQLKDIDCIKAHATGSENNNLSEAKAIKLLFEKYNQTTKVTALKPTIGHTLGACGTNEIVLMIYSLKSGFLPATFGFETPAEDVVFTPLEQNLPYLKNATFLFNFVAFGGNNTSIILSNKD
ncbi:beta-ketoacyl synthase [Malaciobacter mytili LMG 24559]|uniref:Beta-ketoacyl synthase n=1 Tax=Malaciobacter mytili LMG 24559 TaxID=1032238 RepID=A0AAX2AH53_9BACT|nr:beta-ketoacyl synthase N-terminal-like domain-containing protein [Malaciobacter mytili]AXH13848.1 beta-ketoacyl-[acp] synthase [Malaciobacter mytili LMG 24559]RXK15499.1 beta-ketoacyl synthase [Malaciobacter mytili LMG 24559]